MTTIKSDSRVVFFTTSPRSPEKMIPEIKLLDEHFSGMVWNAAAQAEFSEILSKEDSYRGSASNDPAFSARDRINRGPQTLGFVRLKPIISLSPAGKLFISSERTEEILLRQLLKFQLPSVYHKIGRNSSHFCVKPFLEILRLIRQFGSLRFDELMLFGLQITDWRNYDAVVHSIERFREEKLAHTGSYNRFLDKYKRKVISSIYAISLAEGRTQTRESVDKSTRNFLETKARNMRDYTDACFRYLRATGIVSISHIGKSISILPERLADVDYILKTVEREPCFIDDKEEYLTYLGDASLPRLLTDNKEQLLNRLKSEFPTATIDGTQDTLHLKRVLANLYDQRKQEIIEAETAKLKDHKSYDEVQDNFDKLITKDGLYDAPLMFEWNVWRAMNMIDGGNIRANLKFDDYGKPMTVAGGNVADIVCDYGDFLLNVEVTLASGQRQYETEGESVSRHLGSMKKQSGKSCYCLFIAPVINEATIAHFFTLHRTAISYYGGKSVIVPLPLNVFRKMLEDSYKLGYTPSSQQIRHIFEYSESLAASTIDEVQWFEGVKNFAVNWLG